MDTKRIMNYEIFSGPSRDRLVDAFKYAYDGDAHVAINFGVAIGYTMPPGDPGRAYVPMTINDIVITGIKHDGSTGNSFNIQGYCTAVLLNIGGKKPENYNFAAFYDAKTHSGTISFRK